MTPLPYKTVFLLYIMLTMISIKNIKKIDDYLDPL